MYIVNGIAWSSYGFAQSKRSRFIKNIEAIGLHGADMTFVKLKSTKTKLVEPYSIGGLFNHQFLECQQRRGPHGNAE